ncbi:MAG: hypothetical protein R6U21_05310 [Thermoplasmatota archaeon]
MKPIQLRQHLIPIYLALMLLVLAPLSVLVFLQIMLPLILISLGIYFNEKNLGFVGLLFFYVFSITQLQVASIDHTVQLFLYSVFMLIPSLLLTSKVLTIDTDFFPRVSVFSRKKQLGISAIILICLLVIIFFLIQYLGLEILFQTQSVQEQVLLFGSISLLLFLPLLLKNTEVVKLE